MQYVPQLTGNQGGGQQSNGGMQQNMYMQRRQQLMEQQKQMRYENRMREIIRRMVENRNRDYMYDVMRQQRNGFNWSKR